MPIIAASILAKNGSILLSRQFSDLCKNSIEQYLSTFTHCLSSESQHTFIDGDTIRYVYQPMGLLYMILITTLDSNIFEDLETLRMLSRIVSHYCYPINEDSVRTKALTLVFAVDELISLGYRENMDLNGIIASIEMHSENEILAEIVKKDRENQAKETMKRKAKEFDMIQKMQRQQERLLNRGNASGGIFNSQLASLASNIFNNLKGNRSLNSPSYNNFQSLPNDFGSSSDRSRHSSPRVIDANEFARGNNSYYSANKSDFGKSVKSLKLKKSAEPTTYSNNYSDNIGASHITNTSTLAQSLPTINSSASNHKIRVKLNEAVSAVINRNGQLDKYEVTGKMTVNVTNNEMSNTKLQLSQHPNSKLTIQTHPNIDKKLFVDNSLIAIKDDGRDFPLNNDIGVLKWRYTSNNMDALILQFNSWIDKTSDTSVSVIVDLELNDTNFTLNNVTVCFQLEANFHGNPNVINISEGQFSYSKNTFMWQISILDKNTKNASIELSIDGYVAPVNSLYPIKCNFSSQDLLLQSQIKSLLLKDGESVNPDDYVIQTSLSTEIYDIV